MATTAGVSANNIVITTLKYGSITMDADVTTSAAAGSSEETTIKNNLNNYLTNLDIAGLKASVTTTSTTTPTNNDDDDGSNTGLIVAIVVPIVVVCNIYLI